MVDMDDFDIKIKYTVMNELCLSGKSNGEVFNSDQIEALSNAIAIAFKKYDELKKNS